MREALAGPAPTPTLLAVGDEAFASAVDEAPTTFRSFSSHRDDAAIWLFSGGTTGTPKAVVQPHRSCADTTALCGQGVRGLGPDDITLSVPKLFFGDAMGSNVFFPFSVGASCVLLPERTHLGKVDPGALARSASRA